MSGLAGVAVIASSFVAGAAPAAAEEESYDPFLCRPESVYVVSDRDVIREFVVDGDDSRLLPENIGTGHQGNALGISSDGRYAYTTEGGGNVVTYDKRSDEIVGKKPVGVSGAILRGAVHPVTGVYYFASGTVGDGINLYAWDDKSGGEPQSVQVGVLKPERGDEPFGANGDMAFSASGQLLIVADSYIYAADVPTELERSTREIRAKEVHFIGSGVLGNGIAFGNYGHIFVSTSERSNNPSKIIEVDLVRGETVAVTELDGFAATDLGSCTFPNTITLKKDLPQGRHGDDRFELRIGTPAGYKTEEEMKVAVTDGDDIGVQSEYVGPIFTNQGDRFTLSESLVGGGDMSGYVTSLSCLQVDEDSSEPLEVTDDTVIQPAGDLGTEVVCTYTNDKLAPALDLRKSADPAAGTPVQAGQRITYTIEAENTGNTELDPVVIDDDLSDVLEYAEYQGDVSTTIDESEQTGDAAASVSTDDGALAWTGALDAGETVTITYSVIVDDDVEGETIANRVTASGTPPNGLDDVTPPGVETTHPVAGFEIAKTSTPEPGAVVEPGDTIRYTVTGTNTGATALDPASLTDDLSEVLAFAELDGDVVTAIDGDEITDGAARIVDDELIWNGSLAEGETVAISYSVVVGENASEKVLRNIVTGSATPTGPDPADPDSQIPGDEITPQPESTEHPVFGSGFTVSKSATPPSGTAVEAGDTVEYKIVGTNTGDTALDPAEILDDLSAVLDVAEYNDDVRATRGTASVDGDRLAWTGVIPKGESVTITYSVTVEDGVDRALLRNVATGEATPQIPVDPSDPDRGTKDGTKITAPESETKHPVVDNGFEIDKSSEPGSGSAVNPGDTIAYTVTATNTGNTVLTDVEIVDDLSHVLSDATLDEVSATPVDAGDGEVTQGDDTLRWTGTLAPGEDVTITYTVTVNDGVTGVLLRNTVSGEGTPQIPVDPTDPGSPTEPGEPLTPTPDETRHPVVDPGFEITKTADPDTGARVDPGSTITYTVIGANTGDTALSDVSITDDLTGVLAHAAYTGDVKASTGTVDVQGETLSWKGDLDVDEKVTITYSVTVDPDAGGETIANSVSGWATPQIPTDPSDPESETTPGERIDPPTVTTEHPVNKPGFTFTKSVDPTAGTAVDPGQVLTYTLTGTNTGETALDPVEISDDLSGVLECAQWNDDAKAVIDGENVAAPTLDGQELSWTGALAVGQSVVVTYSVTVGPDAVGEVLENAATGSATPPGGRTITPPTENTENPVNVPGFSISKSADPEAGTAVDPGTVITYTVTGVNTGETALDPVEIVDDLADVLAHARYNGDAQATITADADRADDLADAPAAAAPTVDDDELTWTGALEVGQTVTITYSVTVAGEAGGTVLRNSVTGSATPPGGVPPIETPPATTEHRVNEPGFALSKTADPASGTRVDPGSVVTYTVTGVNTGETALDEVVVSDDLTAVLAHAVYNDDAVARIGDADAAAPVVADGELSWNGALAIGERVTITYSVTVNGDAGGEMLANTVSGVAVPPGGVELTPPPSTTENPVGEPGFAFVKTSDPASGSRIATGSVVTYTLTGTNTGETALDEVSITDDLGEVLPYATWNDDVAAEVAGEPVAAPERDGDTLSWTGALAEGQTVTITYSVTVDASAAGETLRNVATATATPPGGETITSDASGTEHPVLTPLAITGGQLAPWLIGLVVLLLGAGLVLLMLRRRTRTAA